MWTGPGHLGQGVAWPAAFCASADFFKVHARISSDKKTRCGAPTEAFRVGLEATGGTKLKLKGAPEDCHSASKW